MNSLPKPARVLWTPLLLMVIVLGAGCPYIPGADPEYDLGFAAGFMEDGWYWEGFDDSYYTVDFGPIYYEGSDITYVEYPPYDAGYWDGVWQAYNDGYFVAYDYAFTIGFSEGYDAAFAWDYLDFLAADVHVEYLDGGWSDGYNDGFSEGRVFGANDYETLLPFDWLDALLDYRAGTDLYFEEVDVGTGAYGPVILYTYGTDPAATKTTWATRGKPAGQSRTIRRVTALKADNTDGSALSYRPLDATRAERFEVAPSTSTRGDRPLTITATWLDRVNDYLNATEPAAKRRRARRVNSE